MILNKRRLKYIYYDNVRTSRSILNGDVYNMDEAPPGTGYHDCDTNGRFDDTDERRGQHCRVGRDINVDLDDGWRVGYKRNNDVGSMEGQEDSAYTLDSTRWTEEEWLFYEQTQNEI